MSWSNWTGDQTCTPRRAGGPRSRQELVEVVAGAAADGRTVKVAGSGHSFSECALTDGVMVHLGGLDQVLDADGELVKVQAGIVLRDLSRRARRSAAGHRRTSATSTSRRSPGRSRRPPTAPA